MRDRNTLRAMLLVVAGLLSSATASKAAVIYSNDFSGTGGNVDFPNEPGVGTWTVGSGLYTYTQTGSASGGSNNTVDVGSGGVTQLTSVGNSFVVETRFKVTGIGGSGANANTVGLILFGDATSANYYHAQFVTRQDGTTANVGLLTLASVGAGSSLATSVNGDTELRPYTSILNNQYTLRVEGTRTLTALNLRLSLFDAAGTTQIGTSATATDTTGIFAGQYFGLRYRSVMSGTTTAQFDDFSVKTVPEPAIGIALGGVALLGRRRRRRSALP